MPHCIAHAFEPLLRLLRPAPGRRRRPDHSSVGLAEVASTACPPRAPAVQVLRGEETSLVRPYLPAYERRETQKRQARRRTLQLAVRAVDIGPRLFHAGEVTA